MIIATALFQDYWHNNWFLVDSQKNQRVTTLLTWEILWLITWCRDEDFIHLVPKVSGWLIDWLIRLREKNLPNLQFRGGNVHGLLQIDLQSVSHIRRHEMRHLLHHIMQPLAALGRFGHLQLNRILHLRGHAKLPVHLILFLLLLLQLRLKVLALRLQSVVLLPNTVQKFRRLEAARRHGRSVLWVGSAWGHSGGSSAAAQAHQHPLLMRLCSWMGSLVVRVIVGRAAAVINAGLLTEKAHSS